MGRLDASCAKFTPTETELKVLQAWRLLTVFLHLHLHLHRCFRTITTVGFPHPSRLRHPNERDLVSNRLPTGIRVPGLVNVWEPPKGSGARAQIGAPAVPANPGANRQMDPGSGEVWPSFDPEPGLGLCWSIHTHNLEIILVSILSRTYCIRGFHLVVLWLRYF